MEKKQKLAFGVRIAAFCLGLAELFCLLVFGGIYFGGASGSLERATPWIYAAGILWAPFFICLVAQVVLRAEKAQKEKTQP